MRTAERPVPSDFIKQALRAKLLPRVKGGDDGQRNSLRLRGSRRRGGRMARYLWRRGFASRHIARTVRRRGRENAIVRRVRTLGQQVQQVCTRAIDVDLPRK